MLFGVFGRTCLDHNGRIMEENLKRRGLRLKVLYGGTAVRAGLAGTKDPGSGRPWNTEFRQDGKNFAVMEGELYPPADWGKELFGGGGVSPEQVSGRLGKWNGAYSIAVWQDDTQTGLLAADVLGIRRMFYAFRDGGVVFCTGLRTLAAALGRRPGSIPA